MKPLSPGCGVRLNLIFVSSTGNSTGSDDNLDASSGTLVQTAPLSFAFAADSARLKRSGTGKARKMAHSFGDRARIANRSQWKMARVAANRVEQTTTFAFLIRSKRRHRVYLGSPSFTDSPLDAAPQRAATRDDERRTLKSRSSASTITAPPSLLMRLSARQFYRL